MSTLIEAKGLTKLYGPRPALDRVDFTVDSGRIVGLIGPNGAGKTTLVRAILGLTQCKGRLSVFGRDPFRERAAVMRDACFIADVALLPAWLKVGQAVDFLAGVHPRFRRARALSFLDKARVARAQRIQDLSKGTKTQVHLALAMAIDARLLVLDEPTLGLDPIARRGFYRALVEDYMDETRTLLVTTHQVEELENLLTDVLFLDRGRIVLDSPVEDIGVHYSAVAVQPGYIDAARAQRPFYEHSLLGKTVMYFEKPRFEILAGLGEVRLPGVADLFVALMSRRGA